MAMYHWLVLVIVVLAVIAICSRVAGAVARTVISVIAVVLFAGFVWGTIPEQDKTSLSTFWENSKYNIAEFFKGVFDYGQNLPEKQEEAVRELYK